MKKSKNWHFSMVLLKNWSFSNLFFLDNIGKENVFYDILERKNVFVGNKNNKLKKLKNWHFSMVLLENWSFFQVIFFRQYRLGKRVLWYSRTKKSFVDNNNNKLKKSKNWHFSKGINPWFCTKIGHFSIFFFFGNIGQENVFYDILEQKKRLSRE